jgi:ATP-dependent helicase Lhr and Lhr-like helicase
MVPEVVRAILAPSTPPTWLDASSGRSPALPGLSSKGYPGTNRSVKQVQASSGLLYYVFARYDPDNLLLFQAHREVLERQLEQSRLGRTLERIAHGKVIVTEVERPTCRGIASGADALSQ